MKIKCGVFNEQFLLFFIFIRIHAIIRCPYSCQSDLMGGIVIENERARASHLRLIGIH